MSNKYVSTKSCNINKTSPGAAIFSTKPSIDNDYNINCTQISQLHD